MQSEINIRIGSKSPKEYLTGVKVQCNGGGLKFGCIDSMDALLLNFRTNAIPESLFEMELPDYENFLLRGAVPNERVLRHECGEVVEQRRRITGAEIRLAVRDFGKMVVERLT